jgi:hypothetical protein
MTEGRERSDDYARAATSIFAMREILRILERINRMNGLEDHAPRGDRKWIAQSRKDSSISPFQLLHLTAP